MRVVSLFLLIALYSSCYEDRVGCLDPDATNYELRADEGCADCCTYPSLSIRVSTVWKDSALVSGRQYTDGAGNRFQFVRFRYYLGDLRLESTRGDLPDPVRPVDLLVVSGQDTASASLNGNYLLASTVTSTSQIGTVRTRDLPITGLSASYGLDDRFRGVIPSSLPSGDALRTQPGLLNYRDGRGYVQARLEYTLEPGGDTISASSYGSVPLSIDFGREVPRVQGFNVRLDVEARLADLIGRIDLSADTAQVAFALGQAADFLTVVSITQ